MSEMPTQHDKPTIEDQDKETENNLVKRANIKADIMRALDDGDADAATDALIKAGHYLLDLDQANELMKNSFEGTDSYGPPYWRKQQIPMIINRTPGVDYVVYLDSVNRIKIIPRDGQFQLDICGPPNPNVLRRWELVEQAFDAVYGENGDPHTPLATF